MITRRATIAALAGLAATRRAQAQDFPSRTVTIIVPYPGGGAGVIGSVAVQHAEPDGHTLVLGTNQTHATNQSLLKNCPYDAVRDFAPVAGITEIPHVLVVRHGLEAE